MVNLPIHPRFRNHSMMNGINESNDERTDHVKGKMKDETIDQQWQEIAGADCHDEIVIRAAFKTVQIPLRPCVLAG